MEEDSNIISLDYISDLHQENQDLRNQIEDYKSRIENAIEYINNFSVDKSFNFPLMKRWEESQVKSSIDYEFKTTLY